MSENRFCLLVILLGLFQKSQANGNAILEVISDSGNPTQDKYCIQYNSALQRLPESIEDALPLNLEDFSDILGCNASEYEGHAITSQDSLFAVMRGNCKYSQKAQVAESKNAAALLVIDYKNSSSIAYPWVDKKDMNTPNISLAMIAWHNFHKIIKSGGQIQVNLYAPPNPKWDANMIFIVFGSTLLVLVASLLSIHDERKKLKHQQARVARANQNGENIQEDESGLPITVCNAVVWFACMCGVILILYFFFRYVVYVFIALFCIAGAQGLYNCLLPLWTRIMPIRYDIPLNKLPCCKIKSKADLGSLILLMPCVTLAIFWAVQRHASYAWVLQDILGACFCVNLIKELRTVSLKIICFLLVLLLVYDVFFVFITPFLTSNGESIMVSVATGGSDKGGAKSKERVPLLFMIPLFGDSTIYMCRDRLYSLLGFGDVIIPGILVSQNAACDIWLRANGEQRPRVLYFFIGIIGYFVGMTLCMISMVLMETGQPALLYLIPCTLIPTVTVALCRKELGLLFGGRASIYAARLDNVESQVQDNHSDDDNEDDLNETPK